MLLQVPTGLLEPKMLHAVLDERFSPLQYRYAIISNLIEAHSIDGAGGGFQRSPSVTVSFAATQEEIVLRQNIRYAFTIIPATRLQCEIR